MSRAPKKSSIFATGEDVAKLAGVSTITVSRVFNPTWEGKIRKETADKVRSAAAQLKYQPNGVARSLANSRTDIVAVVVGQSTGFFYIEFLMQLVQRIQRSGRQALVYTLDLYHDLDSILSRVSQHRVDAVVVTSSALREDVSTDFREIGIPVILFKRSAEHSNLSGVWCDEQEGAREAARHLLGQGKKRIGVVVHPEGGTHRGAAFIEEIRRAGVEPVCVACSDYTYTAGQRAAREMLAVNALDAVFCEEDTMAMAFKDAALRDFGLQVPQQLAIVGFDNNFAAALPAYDITTVSHPLDAMIEALIESIEYLLENPSAQMLRCFQMKVLPRSTT